MPLGKFQEDLRLGEGLPLTIESTQTCKVAATGSCAFTGDGAPSSIMAFRF
jgi:hypothetical protein